MFPPCPPIVFPQIINISPGMACAPANMMSTNKFRVTQVTLVHINFSAACIDEQKTLIQLTSLLTLVKQYILYI